MKNLTKTDIHSLLDKCEAVINSCTVDSADACYRYLYLCVRRIRPVYMNLPNDAVKEAIVRRLIALNNLMQSSYHQCQSLLGKSSREIQFILPTQTTTVAPVLCRIGMGTYRDNFGLYYVNGVMSCIRVFKFNAKENIRFHHSVVP